MKNQSIHIKEIQCLMDEAESWVVLAHRKPDGDTLGCLAAVVRLGHRLSKSIICGGGDPLPNRYKFMLDDIDYRALPEKPSIPAGSIIICLDTSNEERSVSWINEAKSEHTVINIDHHRDNSGYGAINFVDYDASATGEIITELIASSKWGVSKREAEALYIAIVSDNGYFSFPSVTTKSHECAKVLIEAGVSPSDMAEAIDSSLAVNDLWLWGRAMARAQVFADGRAALFWLDADDFAETETDTSRTEGLVNKLLSIRGVRIVALLSEVSDGTRVSLRARIPLNVRMIASSFGGGGHDLAAACTIHASVPAAIETIKSEIERHVESRFPSAE